MMCKTNLDGSNYCDNVLNSPEAGHRDNTDTHGIRRHGLCEVRMGHMSGPESLSTGSICLSGVNYAPRS